MNKLLIGALLALMATLSASAAGAEEAHGKGSAAEGRNVALQVCWACHVVAPDQEFPPMLNQHTPSFDEIANNPNTTAKSLRQFISKTHWNEQTIPMTMPNPMLVDEQTTEVVNYILSLRKHP
jgi:mono/diheme cytochrome c family protein